MIRIEGAPILTAAQMRGVEAASGLTTEALMARAGGAIAEQIRRLAMGADVLVACGPGNNGGDGYVAAAILRDAHVPVRVTATGEPTSEAARRARAGWAGPVAPIAEAEPATILVDALFGAGLSRPLDDATVFHLRRLQAGARLSIAVDLPSGVATDDGRCMSDVPVFDLTLALGVLKPAHVLQPAAARARALAILDIGVVAASDTATLAQPLLNAPGPADHKYTRGMVAIVAGAMPGAAALAAVAAGRSGAGYVLLLGSATDRLPHAIVRRRYAAEAIADPRIGALLIGPGLGRSDVARTRLADALAARCPLVIDGDALHLLDLAAIANRAAPTILTPHAGEFDALFGKGDGAKIDRARAAAARAGATIVFKGADTVVASPDGRVRVATRRAPWLSTAGTGDTLAGIATALLARDHDPFAAATAAVWLHAEAARIAGPAFLADDLADALPAAIARCL